MGDTDTWLVCIGASAGGLRALTSFLKGAVGPEASPWCGVFVQHLAKGTESMLAELLERRTSLEVVEAQTGGARSARCALRRTAWHAGARRR